MTENPRKLNVLFLCTGNSCRSQMAEGFAIALKSDCIEAFSAGVSPCFVHKRAITVMAEVGIDISTHTSKHVDDLCGVEFDYVISLCDHANETCPRLPGKTKHIHHPFSDPSFLMGTEEIILNAFRKTRDEIRNYIATLPEALTIEQEKND